MQATYIIVGFSRPKTYKIMARAISWWINKPYSHVYLRFESSVSGIPTTIYHAAQGMVHFRTYDNFLKNNISVVEYKIPVTQQERRNMLAHCMRLSGERYGYCELVKIFISDLYHWLFKKELILKDGSGYICSELVGTLLVEVLRCDIKKPLNLLKPNEVEQILKNNNLETV